MTHTKHRKRRERSTIRVERLYPALIEGRMARGHRSLDGPEPWRPMLHGWRDIGYLTSDYGTTFHPLIEDYTRPAPPNGWSAATSDPLSDIAAAVEKLAVDAGYVVTEEQRLYLQRLYAAEERLALGVAPPTAAHRIVNPSF